MCMIKINYQTDGTGLNLEHLLLLRISCFWRSNHQATAKSNGYNQRYKENRTINTGRDVLLLISLIKWSLQRSCQICDKI